MHAPRHVRDADPQAFRSAVVVRVPLGRTHTPKTELELEYIGRMPAAGAI